LTKPFRNNGVEGGYGSIETQNWLYNAHRSQRRAAKAMGEEPKRWNISAAKEKPVKVETKWRFDPDMDQRASLLAYAQTDEPSFHGKWASNMALYGNRLIDLMTPPTRWAPQGSFRGPYGLGAKFQITGRGRDYVEWLKAKGY